MGSTPESSQRWTCVASWVTMGTSLPSSLSTSLWIRTELLGVCLHHDQWLRSPLSSERLGSPARTGKATLSSSAAASNSGPFDRTREFHAQ